MQNKHIHQGMKASQVPEIIEIFQKDGVPLTTPLIAYAGTHGLAMSEAVRKKFQAMSPEDVEKALASLEPEE